MKEVRKIICIVILAAVILSIPVTAVFGETVNMSSSNSGSLMAKKDILLERGGGMDTQADRQEIRINRKKVKLGMKQTLRLKAFLRSSAAKGTSLRWLSSNWNIARVSPNGTIKGIRPGRVTITVFLKSNPAIRARCIVTVGYTIKYHTRGGRLAERSPRVYYNEKVILKAPRKRGYDFAGWYTDEEYTEKITYIEKGTKKNYILYAKWKR